MGETLDLKSYNYDTRRKSGYLFLKSMTNKHLKYMEQFNLDTWLKDKSRKIVTRKGRPVRIVCWDKLGDYPIIGCVKYSDFEDLETYDSNGFKYSVYREDPNDLFFADEKEKSELTEFEASIYTLINLSDPYNFPSIEEVKEEAKILLDLARKQIEETNVIIEKEKYLTICDQYYNNGKKEALKDFPKWKRSNSFFNTGNKFELGKTSLRRFDGYEIPYSELEKLPNE